MSGADPGTTELDAVRADYLRFAHYEARGQSDAYERLATAVADSELALDFVLELPRAKRQPNLVLASIRWVCGVARDAAELERFLLQEGPRIRTVVEERRTQTNEPGRCATLLPILAALPQPLALLEVGASAGLCLMPDRYAYDYGVRSLQPSDAVEAPVLRCIVETDDGLPAALPEIAWRRGIDLNPIDVRDSDQSEWLENLVWPGQAARLDRVRGALAVARVDPPTVERGDLVDALESTASMAPTDATLVVFHSAVLSYASPEKRSEFRRLVETLDGHWVSNEGVSVLPELTARVDGPTSPGQFLTCLDGEPMAWSGPHGQSFEWIGQQRGTSR